MHEAAHAIRSKKGRKMENDYSVPTEQTAPEKETKPKKVKAKKKK